METLQKQSTQDRDLKDKEHQEQTKLANMGSEAGLKEQSSKKGTPGSPNQGGERAGLSDSWGNPKSHQETVADRVNVIAQTTIPESDLEPEKTPSEVEYEEDLAQDEASF